MKNRIHCYVMIIIALCGHDAFAMKALEKKQLDVSAAPEKGTSISDSQMAAFFEQPNIKKAVEEYVSMVKETEDLKQAGQKKLVVEYREKHRIPELWAEFAKPYKAKFGEELTTDNKELNATIDSYKRGS